MHRVLIVDDQVDILQTMRALLELEGYEVHTASDGMVGFETAARVRPHACVLDLVLPLRDGYALARSIRAAPWGKDVFLIAMTGSDIEANHEAAHAAGFDHLSLKPVFPETIVGFLRAASLRGR
jgi:CheY-like chemotaxis protein